MASTFLWCGLAVGAYMTAVFLLALILKDNSIVDVAWGPGFFLVVLIVLLRASGAGTRFDLTAALVTVWGFRLAAHIFLRRRGKGEDFRYAQWRRSWGRWFILRSFFQIYVLQGLFLLVIAYPLILIGSAAPSPLGALDFAGLAVWLVGFAFEAIGDWQLARFVMNKDNRGRLMTSGLWRYSRHPNYFGEAAMWWGIFLIALAVPGGWRGIVSPLFITFLLLKVSGVPMLEKKYAGHPDWPDYARRTSVFVPWFPRRERRRDGDSQIPS
jgi:steroid 5-alpha reductase family enzyme